LFPGGGVGLCSVKNKEAPGGFFFWGARIGGQKKAEGGE